MFESLAKALASGLSIWEHKEKTRYQEKLFQLKRDYRDEMAKPIGTKKGSRRNNVLDNLSFELRILADSWSTLVGAKDA
jgi:hypothetical protein